MHARHTLVSFFGLGSATAAPLLYTYIKEHPQVGLTEVDTNFFSDAKIFAKGLDWYENHFAKGEGISLYGELASNYLASTQSAGLIARTYPNAKLFAIIENPLVSVRVDYVEARRSGKINAKTSLAMFLKLHPEVLLRAAYGRQLAHYFSYYSPNDFLVLLAADVRKKPLESIKAVYTHLELETTFVPSSLRHLVPIEIDDTKKKPGLIKRFVLLIKRGVKFFYTKLRGVVKPPEVPIETASVIARKIPLSPELEKFLKDYYRKDVKQLNSLLHRNVESEWGFDDE
ncbi:MAG: hypothetical protein R3B53_01690 [Candidatus Paceibacterota bacterium]